MLLLLFGSSLTIPMVQARVPRNKLRSRGFTLVLSEPGTNRKSATPTAQHTSVYCTVQYVSACQFSDFGDRKHKPVTKCQKPKTSSRWCNRSKEITSLTLLRIPAIWPIANHAFLDSDTPRQQTMLWSGMASLCSVLSCVSNTCGSHSLQRHAFQRRSVVPVWHH